MSARKDLTGKRFGKLVVVEYAGCKNSQATWKVQCDCGNTKVVYKSVLLSGATTSCGCYFKEVRNDPEVLAKLNESRKASEAYLNRKPSWDEDKRAEARNRTEQLWNDSEYRAQHTGANAPNWKGGMSYGKYCAKFNEELKEQVREAFGRKCFHCGAEEGKYKHSVHHVDYNKVQGCKGMRWSLIPLCTKCHGHTNFNRWYWFNKFANYWVEAYDLPQ